MAASSPGSHHLTSGTSAPFLINKTNKYIINLTHPNNPNSHLNQQDKHSNLKTSSITRSQSTMGLVPPHFWSGDCSIWNSVRYSGSNLLIFPLKVLALYSNLSDATQTGTTLCASTSWIVTESLTFLQILSLQVLISRNGEKSVTNKDAPHSLTKFGIVSSASPYMWTQISIKN